jgi:hypothetical protein
MEASMAFFVLFREQSQRGSRAPTQALFCANQAYATRDAAEAGQRHIADRASVLGNPAPECSIVEAVNVKEALVQAGSPIPPRVC